MELVGRREKGEQQGQWRWGVGSGVMNSNWLGQDKLCLLVEPILASR